MTNEECERVFQEPVGGKLRNLIDSFVIVENEAKLVPCTKAGFCRVERLPIPS